jgi:hypothetical protein
MASKNYSEFKKEISEEIRLNLEKMLKSLCVCEREREKERKRERERLRLGEGLVIDSGSQFRKTDSIFHLHK